MTEHVTVLLNEAVEMLNVKEDGIYVDGTLGRGGHSLEILKRLKTGKLYCFDIDEEAIKKSKLILKDYNNVIYIHDNYMNMNKYIDHVDGILLDLGVSSPQFDEAERGFSYRSNGPLDMRMDRRQVLKASDIINSYSEKDLVNLIKNYGEEKFAKSIAKAIVLRRADSKIESTLDLVGVIKDSLPNKVLQKKGHPAKQTFQALRIEVNSEINSLSYFLNNFNQILNKKGRVVIITFQSLEDRLVKEQFKRLSSVIVNKRIAVKPNDVEIAKYHLLNRKVVVPSEDEMDRNHRSKSAKLRGIERLD